MIYTDNKAPTFALSSKTDKHSPRTFRRLDYISQFTSDIRHIPETENVPPDELSRLPVSSILRPSSIDCYGTGSISLGFVGFDFRRIFLL